MNAHLESSAESDDVFFAGCSLPDSPEARRVVAAVRRTIAELGGTSVNRISARNTIEDLEWLPFWSNCGDVGFKTDMLAAELQRNVGVTQAQLELIRDPDIVTTMTVAEFVRDVWNAIHSS